MTFLSILAKTFALALALSRPWWALGFWLAGAALDDFAARRSTPADRLPSWTGRLFVIGGLSGLLTWLMMVLLSLATVAAWLKPLGWNLPTGRFWELAVGDHHWQMLWNTQSWPVYLLLLAVVVVYGFDVRRTAPAEGWRRWLLRLAVLNGTLLVLGWVAASGCDYAAMRWKEGIPVFASLTSWLLGLFGCAAGSRDGLVLFTTMAGPLEFAASIDAMALKIPALFLVLALVRLLWAQTPVLEALRRMGVVTAVLLAAAVVRLAAVVLLSNTLFDFVGYETEELPNRPFMGQPVTWLFWLPFLLACGVWLNRLMRGPDTPPAAAAAPLPMLLRWGLAPAALVLGLAVFWQPQGTLKKGDVVIANWHAQWSQCDRPYDRDWYGADSGYNYACLKRLFGFFQPVRLTSGPLSAKDLAGASTLVVYDPDRQFNPDQLKLVEDFVREGGGLMVIGDHTNVFGSGTHLNELVEPFGFQYRDDVLFDLDGDFHQIIDAPPLSHTAWHGIEFFKLRGPTSIRPTSLWTRPVYQVGHSKGVRAIYSVNNFYPPPHDNPKMQTGDFCVAATASYGKGRVAAWGDSTVFSNFEIFYPGKYEYLLNTLHWLNHQDSGMSNVARRMGLLVLCAGTLVLLLLYRRPQVWLGTLAAVAGGLLAAWALGRVAEHRRAGFPQPLTPSDWVVFAAGSEDKAHNLRDFVTKGPYDQRYEVFIQWVLRTGAMAGFHILDKPAGNGLYQHLRNSGQARVAKALIVRKPEDLAQLEDFAAIPAVRSDPVLLMFASSVPVDQALAAAQRCGLLGTADAARFTAAWPQGEALIGEGGRRLLVVAGAERFSDQNMGISEKVTPDATQRAKFTQAFGLIDRLLGRNPPPQP